MATRKPKEYIFDKVEPRRSVVFVWYPGKHGNNVREGICLKEPPKVFKSSVGKNLMDDVMLVSFDVQSVGVYRPQYMLKVLRRMGHIPLVYPLYPELVEGLTFRQREYLPSYRCLPPKFYMPEC